MTELLIKSVGKFLEAFDAADEPDYATRLHSSISNLRFAYRPFRKGPSAPKKQEVQS